MVNNDVSCCRSLFGTPGWTQQLPDLGGTVNPRNLPRLTRLPIEMPLRRMTLVRQRNGKRFSKGDWSRIHAVLGFDLLSISFFLFYFSRYHGFLFFFSLYEGFGHSFLACVFNRHLRSHGGFVL
jgi:hypothetical protein